MISPDPQNDLECEDETCFMLRDISEDPQHFFKENTTFLFLPGVHTGNSRDGHHLVVVNTTGISLIGSASLQTVIECSGSFGLAFVNVTNLKLWNIRFVGCGANVSQFITSYVYRTSPQIGTYPDGNVINDYAEPTFRSTIHMVDVMNVDIWAIDIYHSNKSSAVVGVNLVGSVSFGYSEFIDNDIDLLLIADDSAQNFLDTRIRIQEQTVFSGAHGSGLLAVFYQQRYNIALELQDVVVEECNTGSSYGGIVLILELCHNSLHIDRLNSSYCWYNHMLLYLWNYPNSQCLRNGKIVVSNSHFQQVAIGVTVRNWGSFAIQAPTFIELVNLTFSKILSPLAIHNIPNITLQNINVTECYGIVIEHENSGITYTGNNFIWNNDGAMWGVMFAWNSNVTFQGYTRLANNKGFRAGVIYAKKSTLIFDGNVVLEENQGGTNGGAIALHARSLMDIRPNARVFISNNHATSYGGGVYVDESEENEILVDSFQQILCFFQPSLQHAHTDHVHGNVVFRNNTAGVAGSELFGGWGDICISYIPSLDLIEVGEEYFNTAFHFSPDPNDLSSIASEPSRVCLCFENTLLPNCNITSYNTTSYPGSTVRFFVVTTGQRFGIVPGIITLAAGVRKVPIHTLQQYQITRSNCTEVSYTVSSSNEVETLELVPQNRDPIFTDIDAKLSRRFGIHKRDLILSWFAIMEVNVFLLPCPLGFVLDLTADVCDCHNLLKEHSINCSIDTQSIYRRASLWIYGQEDGVIVHEHCPLDYCKPGSFDINLERPDDQCAFQHSGVLCGGCQMGYSQVLGSSECKRCSSWWLLMFVPFALAGLALVALLTFLNTTVSVGMINGLLFYANIVQANQATFFPERSKGSVTAVIIAWLNLDVGIEMCYFDDMNAYTKAWLQPIFPLYIWTLVTVIIVSSHYSIRAAKLCGRNAVSVLATLFLLSYAKMLRVFTTTLSFTVLEYPDGQKIKVWLYDGNVPYLQGKHVALFVGVLLITTTLTIPYTIFLLFAHIFQSKSNHRIFRFWVPRLLPLIDAHTGPYLRHHRHWTGALLLLRVVLVLVFSVNILGDPAINLLAISITALGLFVYLALFGSMYRDPKLTKLEFLFHANLLLTATVTLYARLTRGNQEAVAHVFVSLTLIGLAGILCYQVLVVVKTSSIWAKLKKLRPVVPQEVESVELVAAGQNKNDVQMGKGQERAPTTHYIELREPLLSDH